MRPPGFEPGSSAWQADVLDQARLRPPIILILSSFLSLLLLAASCKRIAAGLRNGVKISFGVFLVIMSEIRGVNISNGGVIMVDECAGGIIISSVRQF